MSLKSIFFIFINIFAFLLSKSFVIEADAFSNELYGYQDLKSDHGMFYLDVLIDDRLLSLFVDTGAETSFPLLLPEDYEKLASREYGLPTSYLDYTGKISHTRKKKIDTIKFNHFKVNAVECHKEIGMSGSTKVTARGLLGKIFFNQFNAQNIIDNKLVFYTQDKYFHLMSNVLKFELYEED